MQFMIVYHPGPEGLGINVPLRSQHGATPGVKVIAAWVDNTSSGDSGEDLTGGRTYIVIETDTAQRVNAFIYWMRPYTRKIEVRPVTDYLPAMQVYEAKDPGKWPPTPALSDEQRQQFLGLLKCYVTAATSAEAVEIWRSTSGILGGKDLLDALRMRQELDKS